MQGMFGDEYWEEEVFEYGQGEEVHKLTIPEMEVLEDNREDVLTTSLVEVRETRLGKGLFALQFIGKGRIIREYPGELITQEEADRREMERENKGFCRDYMLDVEGV